MSLCILFANNTEPQLMRVQNVDTRVNLNINLDYPRVQMFQIKLVLSRICLMQFLSRMWVTQTKSPSVLNSCLNIKVRIQIGWKDRRSLQSLVLQEGFVKSKGKFYHMIVNRLY